MDIQTTYNRFVLGHELKPGCLYAKASQKGLFDFLNAPPSDVLMRTVNEHVVVSLRTGQTFGAKADEIFLPLEQVEPLKLRQVV